MVGLAVSFCVVGLTVGDVVGVVGLAVGCMVVLAVGDKVDLNIVGLAVGFGVVGLDVGDAVG